MRRPHWLLPVVLVLLASPLRAQGTAKEPSRPNVGADRNDANSYYTWGVAQLEQDPEEAANAFYWAIRLDPGWADAYYARWVALHLSDKYRLQLYEERDLKTIRSPEVRQIDALRLRAVQLNPYLYKKFEKVMLRYAIEQRIKSREPAIDQAELDDDVRKYLATGNIEERAINAYINGNFPAALALWAADLSAWKNKAYPHAERGRIFYMLGAYDSAYSELTTAVASLQKEDKDEVVFVYESKALYQQSIGMIRERQKNLDAAREAYGQALQEDLSYVPAHVALSGVDLATGDTVGAVSELDLATQIAPNDGYLAFMSGRLLVFAGHDAEALEQLKHSTALEPYFAEPHVYLAAIYDNAGFRDESIAEYNTFLNLASTRDHRVVKVRTRLADLTKQAAPASPPAP